MMETGTFNPKSSPVNNTRRFNDTATLAGRCLLLSARNPDTFFSSIMLPALMMLLFVALFGNLVHVGGTSYVNYIVPGVLLQCIGQCSSTTAIMVNKDMTGGMAGRLSTLPIRKRAVLSGHVLEAFLRCLLTSVIVILAAVLVGFRPSCTPAGWGVVLLLLAGSILAMSWLAVIVGVAAKSAEGASALSSLAIILPYLSSGFVPADDLPEVLKIFARYQPMTPIIDTMRSAFLGGAFAWDGFLTAVLWCAGLTGIFYAVSAVLFRRRLGR